MPKVIEVIYEDGVFKPLKKVDLREGERLKVRIEKRKLNFEPIRLKTRISVKKINELEDELWTFS